MSCEMSVSTTATKDVPIRVLPRTFKSNSHLRCRSFMLGPIHPPFSVSGLFNSGGSLSENLERNTHVVDLLRFDVYCIGNIVSRDSTNGNLSGCGQICSMEETDIPGVIMDSLEMLTVNTDGSPPKNGKRVLRKRMPKPVAREVLNRRCSLKPKKRKFEDMENEKDIKNYYLDKKLKRLPNTLETIFEEKEDSTENTNYIGNKKFKRMIEFSEELTVSKLKKKQRQAKIKKVFGTKFSYKRKTITLQALLDKLSSLQPETPGAVEVDIN